ncbi:uncharacterized protein VTP21DRAFT_10677 [Calcarisporiella thermophila]|uniref:uncharacterized protein n=1 Tax=Calcarisporiella thermophila TaxID=911321 RepID=UPI0037430B5E
MGSYTREGRGICSGMARFRKERLGEREREPSALFHGSQGQYPSSHSNAASKHQTPSGVNIAKNAIRKPGRRVSLRIEKTGDWKSGTKMPPDLDWWMEWPKSRILYPFKVWDAHKLAYQRGGGGYRKLFAVPLLSRCTDRRIYAMHYYLAEPSRPGPLPPSCGHPIGQLCSISSFCIYFESMHFSHSQARPSPPRSPVAADRSVDACGRETERRKARPANGFHCLETVAAKVGRRRARPQAERAFLFAVWCNKQATHARFWARNKTNTGGSLAMRPPSRLWPWPRWARFLRHLPRRWGVAGGALGGGLEGSFSRELVSAPSRFTDSLLTKKA